MLKMRLWSISLFLTSIALVSDGLNISCNDVCGSQSALAVPSCVGQRVHPILHAECNCVVGYTCCRLQCPVDNVSCQSGAEYAMTSVDDCKCEKKSCRACAKPAIVCREGCEVARTGIDPTTGCPTKECVRSCPPPLTSCPTCTRLESFVDPRFCGCVVGRCAPVTCPAPSSPQTPQDCAVVKTIIDECGCPKQVYDSENYCAAVNARVAAMKCEGTCLEKVLRRGGDPCGCDAADCLPLRDSCLASLSAQNCPAGSVATRGTTPCGQPRGVCLKCPVVVQTNDTCDPMCFKVEKTEDANGCPLQICVLRQCPASPMPVCRSCEKPKMAADDCGCVSFVCEPILSCVEFGEKTKPCPRGGVARTPDVLQCGCQPWCQELLTVGLQSNGLFRLIKQPTNWLTAKSLCRITGGILATFRNMDEWMPVGNTYFQMALLDPTLNGPSVWLNIRGDGVTFRLSDGTNAALFSTQRGASPWELDEPDGFNANWCPVFRYSPATQPANSWRDGEKMLRCQALNWFLCRFI